jgi:EmrB/QacA subfamily drug resistance transporter
VTQRVSRRPHAGWTLALLALSQTIIAADYNIVYIALPSTGQALHFTPQDLQWVVSVYALLFGGFLLLGGRAADLHGRRRMFIGALWTYAASSMLGGLAVSQSMLITSRAAQGLAAAFLFPATLSIITTRFAEGRERNRALGVWGSAGASGSALGVLLGGLITSGLGWRWTFFVNVPLAAGAALMARRLLPRDHAAPSGRPNGRRNFDLVDALVGTSGSLLLVYALVQAGASGWTAASTIDTLVAAVTLLIAFVVVESRTRTPLMPLRLFRNRSLSVAAAVTGLFGASLGAQLYLVTVWLQRIHGFTPVKSGLAFLPYSVAIVVGTRIGGRLTASVGVRTGMLLGLITGASGLLLIGSRLVVVGSYGSHLLPGIMVSGLGQGITWTTMWIMASSGSRPDESGIASGIASTSQQLGVAIGLAVVVGVVNRGALHRGRGAVPQQLNTGLQNAFYTAGGIATLAAVIVAVVPGCRRGTRGKRPQHKSIPGGSDIAGKASSGLFDCELG